MLGVSMGSVWLVQQDGRVVRVSATGDGQGSMRGGTRVERIIPPQHLRRSCATSTGYC
jgi:hypothetical protein